MAQDGGLRLGPGPGRGAWLCAPPAARECLEAAVQHRALDRALRVPISGDEMERLRAKLEV